MSYPARGKASTTKPLSELDILKMKEEFKANGGEIRRVRQGKSSLDRDKKKSLIKFSRKVRSRAIQQGAMPGTKEYQDLVDSFTSKDPNYKKQCQMLIEDYISRIKLVGNYYHRFYSSCRIPVFNHAYRFVIVFNNGLSFATKVSLKKDGFSVFYVKPWTHEGLDKAISEIRNYTK